MIKVKEKNIEAKLKADLMNMQSMLPSAKTDEEILSFIENYSASKTKEISSKKWRGFNWIGASVAASVLLISFLYFETGHNYEKELQMALFLSNTKEQELHQLQKSEFNPGIFVEVSQILEQINLLDYQLQEMYLSGGGAKQKLGLVNERLEKLEQLQQIYSASNRLYQI